MKEDRVCSFCKETIPRPKVVIESTTQKDASICEDCVKKFRKEKGE